MAWPFWKRPATGCTSFEMYGGQLSLYRLRRCSLGRCPRCAFLGQKLLATDQCFFLPVGLEEIPKSRLQWFHQKVTMQDSRISGAQSCDCNRSLSLERRHTTQQRVHSCNALLCNTPIPACSKIQRKNVDFEKILRDSGAILMRTSRLQHFESASIGGHGRAIASPHGRGPRGTT